MVVALYTAVKKYKIPFILISTIISTKSSPFNVQTFQVSQRQMMDQKIISIVYVKLLSEPMEGKSSGRSQARLLPWSKIVFFASCGLPFSLLGVTFSRVFMGSLSTLTLQS